MKKTNDLNTKQSYCDKGSDIKAFNDWPHQLFYQREFRLAQNLLGREPKLI